ncbi:hypothetical protein BGZ70_003020 [Mortierella alpina]|uniref:Uncharacterized protein n=1 Tax=Mortierella alpina TaxID=64518 RepID=A0A9P6IWA8_MORAP|nr:hypothetical protein BGZ70_003020 [Mortierella alpina]
MSSFIKFQTMKHLATFQGDYGSRSCKLGIYSGGGLRWTKKDVSIQIGTMLFNQTVKLGNEWTYDLVLNENFEDAITYISVKFGDYTFDKAEFYIGKAESQIQQTLKQRIERNAHLQIKTSINTGECCLIL